ncbi:MAG: hypothetical protein HY279_13160 [Nitrospinae bacterium]|nr:hypothetical protein [Nitrospinota bacterium]
MLLLKVSVEKRIILLFLFSSFHLLNLRVRVEAPPPDPSVKRRECNYFNRTRMTRIGRMDTEIRSKKPEHRRTKDEKK